MKKKKNILEFKETSKTEIKESKTFDQKLTLKQSEMLNLPDEDD